MIDVFLHTLIRRPYVFAFLASFLVIGILNRGVTRTVLLLIVGFIVAFLSEWCSIRWGFPYGDYLYIYQALEGEWLWGGVPVWDSLSYPFLAYAGYETASFLGWKWKTLGGAFLMTLADVVIDPIAVRGDQWFLGKIYFYPESGIYFGVPLSNFAGWFLVGLTILLIYRSIVQRWIHTPVPLRIPQYGAYFYYGIIAFIVCVGIYIGAWAVVAVSLLIHAPIIYLVFKKCRGAIHCAR
jgi:uncharacterized membrane protein